MARSSKSVSITLRQEHAVGLGGRLDDEKTLASSEGPSVRCSACSKDLEGHPLFQLRRSQGVLPNCLACSLFDRTMLLRSLKLSLVVGTLLMVINHGDRLLQGEFPWTSGWYKLPLTYVVPFCVATYGALANAHRPNP